MRPVVEPTPIIVGRLRGLPPLLVEDGFGMADFFFKADASAGAGGYDEWVAENHRDRIELHDVEIINGTMRARSSYEAWKSLYEPSPSWLAPILTEWDLVEMSPEEWTSADCCHLLCKAIERLSVKRVGRAMATKVLHMKRPRLVPILDSLVIETVGGNADEYPTPTDVLVDHLRLVARENAAALADIQSSLTDLAFRPTRVRILDVILWSSHPRSSLHASLGWPTHIGPATTTSPRHNS
jgi:Family of unknown function (DUF6308)